MRSRRFSAFVAPALGDPLWRLAPGLVVAVAIHAGLAVFTVWFLGRALEDPRDILQASQPGSVLLILATFAGMALGITSAVRLVHGRPANTLLGPPPRALRHFAVATAIALPVFALWLIPTFLALPPTQNLALSRWLLLLPLTLAGLAIQAGAEELMFRGYLLQQLAARFRSPLIWALLPSAGFGLLHYAPGVFGSTAWMIAGAATLFALMAVDLTIRTGSLGAAWGLHFANNLFGIGFVATEGWLSGLALFVLPFEPAESGLAPLAIGADILVIGAAWLLIRRALTT